MGLVARQLSWGLETGVTERAQGPEGQILSP